MDMTNSYIYLLVFAFFLMNGNCASDSVQSYADDTNLILRKDEVSST
jgi:hypothetical protein